MKRVLLFAVLVGASALAMTGIGFAGHGDGAPEDDPELVTFGGAGSWACEGGTKIEPVADGTYAASFVGAGGVVFAGSITIDVTSTSGGPVFSFDTDDDSHVVTSVLVKGGPNANLYVYGAGIAHDDGLHAPDNPNSGKYYGLSHLCFFGDKK